MLLRLDVLTGAEILNRLIVESSGKIGVSRSEHARASKREKTLKK
jgi:hypothetical protein